MTQELIKKQNAAHLIVSNAVKRENETQKQEIIKEVMDMLKTERKHTENCIIDASKKSKWDIRFKLILIGLIVYQVIFQEFAWTDKTILELSMLIFS